MSQITSCPSCGTRFRVVADQLRISDGWVRCGQCQEVFDARLHLDAPAAPVAEAPTAAVSAVAAVSPPAPVRDVLLPPPVAEPDAAVPPAFAPAPFAVQASAAPATPAAVVAADIPEPPPTPPAAVPPVGPQAPVASAPPGYELPAPELADDIDFSDYHPAGQVHRPAVWSSPASVRTEPPLASAPAPDTPLHTRAASRWPEEAAPAPAPAWSAAARPASRDAAFPPLDVSVLQVSAPALTPAPDTVPSTPATEDGQGFAAISAATDPVDPVWNQNAKERTSHLREQLSNDEQSSPMEPAAEPHAPVDAEPRAEPAWPALTELPSVDADSAWAERTASPTEATEPAVAQSATDVDALESAAQKLAHTLAQAPAPAMPTWSDGDAASHDEGLDSSLEPGFVRDARRKAWWQKPVVRVAMGAAVVVLPLALLLQVGLHERNALVAWQPSVRPALEFMCTALQCQLGPRQQIAAMVVSGSAFVKGTADRSYQLSLSIQNQARTPVGMPSVELTLTDAQDQAIARKVLSPKELGAPLELKAGSEWSGAVPVTTNGLNLQVVGYRVLLFYP